MGLMWGALLALSGASWAEAPPAVTLAAEVFETRLANGMKVLVKRDARAPTVVQMVWYRAGSIDELGGVTGVAHVLEHMMFKGTETVPAGEFSRRVAAMGGRENAFTSHDYTGYFQQVPAARLAEVMALEADRMQNLRLSAEEFSKEVRVVMEERRLRTDDNPTAQVGEALFAAAFVAHPYRNPVIGWMTDLEAMTVADAQRWYETWYSPANATLVVAGDVTPEAVVALAEQTYGRIPARPVPARRTYQEPEQRGVRRVEVRAPAENPYVLLAFRVPRLAPGANDREPYALEVLASVLDGGQSARLTRHIIQGSRVANQVGAGYDLTGRGPSLFTFAGTPAAGHTVADVEQALRAEVRRIAQEGVPEAELARAKVQYVAGQIYQRDSVFAQAMEVGGLEAVGLSHRDADLILERIRGVTAAEVQAVAAKYFGEAGLTAVTLKPLPLNRTQPARATHSGRH